MKSEIASAAIDWHQVDALVRADLSTPSIWQWVALLLWHAFLAMLAHQLFVLYVVPLGEAIFSLVDKVRTLTKNEGGDHV